MKTCNRAGIAGAAAVAALALALGGCATGRYGTTRWDLEAAQGFSAAQLLPGHRYYLNGSDFGPSAILALREDRPLRGDLWHEVPMTEAKLKDLHTRMREVKIDGPSAHAVLDDQGVRIGVWYSYWNPSPVRLLDDGGVEIAPPFDATLRDAPRPALRGD